MAGEFQCQIHCSDFERLKACKDSHYRSVYFQTPVQPQMGLLTSIANARGLHFRKQAQISVIIAATRRTRDLAPDIGTARRSTVLSSEDYKMQELVSILHILHVDGLVRALCV